MALIPSLGIVATLVLMSLSLSFAETDDFTESAFFLVLAFLTAGLSISILVS